VDLVRFKDADLLTRFEHFVASRRAGQVENADSILEAFAGQEDWRRRRDRLAALPFALAAPTTAGSFLVTPYGFIHILLWIITVITVPFAVYAADRRDAEYLGRPELVAARAQETEPRGPGTA
jgi:hypothetical protein